MVLITNMLETEQARVTGTRIERAPTEINNLVQDVVEGHRAQAELRGLVMSVHSTAPEVWIDTDATRVRQILDNLISNALKYSPAESSVRVDIRVDGGEAVVSVTDAGIGIPEEERDHLFQPFSRLAGARGYVGTGLGLYISRAIVEAHGGTIDVVSTRGKGSTFTVRLPGAVERSADGAGTGTALA